MDFYFYKLTCDDGGAPCIQNGLLSLAICKPNIRKAAGRSDWLFGFGDKPHGERLIYVAEVTDKLYRGDYYRRVEYANRPDCIYEWRQFKGQQLLRWKAGARFHPDGLWEAKDIGALETGYKRAYVLLSSNFRYFGKASTAAWKNRHPALRARVEALGQGERVHHGADVRADLDALRNALWQEFPKVFVGDPSDEEGVCPPCPPDDDEDESDEA